MPQLKRNAFTEYALTAQEQIIGSTFNELQLCVLHNELAMAAAAKLAMKYVGDDKALLQEEAELQGKINAFQWIISAHEAAQQEYLQLQLAAKKVQEE